MESYAKAVDYFKGKQYEDAQKVLLKLLEEDSNDFNVLNFLGVIHLHLNNYKKAINYFQQVIALYPKHAGAYYNLGYSYQKIGKNSLASEHYKKAIKHESGLTDAYLNLGKLLVAERNFSEAEEIYFSAVQNNAANADIYNNLANLYFRLNKWDEAVKYYYRAIELSSGDAGIYFNLGTCYMNMDNDEEAVAKLKKALELKPDYPEAMNNLANIYTKQKKYEEAVELFNKMVSGNEKAELLFNKGYCYHQKNQLDKAVEYYEKALEVDPGLKSAFINIGQIKLKEGKSEEAEKYFSSAVDDTRNRSIAFTNLGLAHLEQLKTNEAINFFELVIKDEPDIVEAHYNLAHALLLTGNYKRGWAEYEWRKKRKEFVVPKLNKPELKTKSIANKKILVYAEQGLGDTIHFIRYLKLLKDKNSYVLFMCDSVLIDLIKNLEWIDELYVTENFNEKETDYDFQIGLLSLPYYFGTEEDTIPSFDKYLKADAVLEKRWYDIIRNNDKLKVGLVWAGNPKNNRDKIRSMKLTNLLPLFSVEDVDFYSLQVGPAVEQLADVYYPITRLDTYIKSFADTAAIISNLDLVISVDTSVAHLTGALGKPVWNMLMFLPDWRWLLKRKDTPWYPSMRLYRQQKKDEWKSVVDEITFDLKKLAAQKNNRKPDKLNDINLPKSGSENNEKILPLYLGLIEGENYGWGVCSKYLRKELNRKLNIFELSEREEVQKNEKINGYLFTGIKNHNLEPLFAGKGIKTFGYTFFEYELGDRAKENAARYDLIFAGSTWCRKKLEAKGINNTETLIQGVDHELFYPGEGKANENLFVIFSGGKFEFRKGQDLVLKAIKILQKKYSDIILINAWYNLWPEFMVTMKQSKHIKYEAKGNTWEEFMLNIYKINDIDHSNIFTLPIVPNNKLRELYLKSDVGLFPNRCEGGTNLVMMEYMACGKPVIASFNSGHKDVLNDKNSLRLTEMKECRIYENNTLIADWSEPDIDEIVEKIEYAYYHREELKQTGMNAAAFMKDFTWEATANKIVKTIYPAEQLSFKEV